MSLEEKVARFLAVIRGHSDLEELVQTDIGKKPIWSFYIKQAKEVIKMMDEIHSR